jgi:hypothetical protein
MTAPKYLYKAPHGSDAYGLRTAAAALKADAKFARKLKCDREFSRALNYAADRLLAMADGMSAAEAFNWPQVIS